MIVVRVEMWPHGSEEGKSTLGTAVIANDGSGDFDLGNYDFVLGKFGRDDPHRLLATRTWWWKIGRVESFPRIKLGPWDLLYRALSKSVGSRNP